MDVSTFLVPCVIQIVCRAKEQQTLVEEGGCYRHPMTQMKIQAKCQMVFAFLCVNLKIFIIQHLQYTLSREYRIYFTRHKAKKNSLFFFPFLKLVQINLICADNRCTHGVYLTTSLQVLCYHTKSRSSIQNYPIIYLAHLTQRVM